MTMMKDGVTYDDVIIDILDGTERSIAYAVNKYLNDTASNRQLIETEMTLCSRVSGAMSVVVKIVTGIYKSG